MRRRSSPRYCPPSVAGGLIGASCLTLVVVASALGQVNNPPVTAEEQPTPEVAPKVSKPAPSGEPVSPFGVAPGVFPGVETTPSATAPRSPFGAAPGTFPGITPAPKPATRSPFGTPTGQLPAPTTATPEEAPVAGAQPTNEVATPRLAPPPLLAPQYGFGNFAPILPPAGTLLPPPTPPPKTTDLAPVRPGALPIQALEPRAPPILFVPTLSLSEAYTDNPRDTPRTLSDSRTTLIAGSALSVDSRRFQGQLNGNVDYLKFARATDQDTLNVNLLGYGLATVVEDHVFVDARAAVTQVSGNGGLGFASPTLISRSQQTQTEVVSLSPFARESFDNYVDAELRYNLGLELFQNGGLLNNQVSSLPNPLPLGSLSNSTHNEGTLSLATGRRFNLFGSKLTLDAAQTDTTSAAKSKQVRGFDDLEYQFNREFAALGRAGYENLRFPLQPAANTAGAMWLAGGRFTPSPGNYLIVRYGKQDGFYGANGFFRYQVTPRTNVTASIQNNLSSAQDLALSNLNQSQVDQNGNFVNQAGLPTSLINPEFALQNNVFRQTEAQLGVQTILDRDTVGLFVVFNHRREVGVILGANASAVPSSDTSRGINISWTRSLTPKLSSAAAIGYLSAVSNHQKTFSGSFTLSYTMTQSLSATMLYQLINTDSRAGNGSFTRNDIEFGIRKSF